MTTDYDVIIIGAGASGLMCALTAAQRERRVLVLDHANKAGKKILMSGGGRCNFTNLSIDANNYLSQNPHFCKSALAQYTQWDFIALVEAYGVAYHERDHGQLFCVNSAQDILQLLLDICHAHDVTIALRREVQDIQTNADDSFAISVAPVADKRTTTATYRVNPTPQTLHCQSLVIATGGLSIPTMGATGFGYQVATQFGHDIVPTSAGLVPFTFTDQLGAAFASLAGTSVQVTASNAHAAFDLAMLFTHRGLSGPAMLQLSNYWQLGEPITLDLLPQLDATDWLLTRKQRQPTALLRNVLPDAIRPALPKKLLATLQNLLWADIADTRLGDIKDQRLMTLGDTLNGWQILPSGTEGYRTAEVTRGGVATDRIASKTMQSQLQPNLYFIGEVLDVTGWLGGYNFQWAWSSGFVAGQVV